MRVVLARSNRGMTWTPLALPTKSNKTRFGFEGAARLINAYVESTGSDAKAMLQFGETWRIDPADGLIQALRDQFGRDNVFLQYR